MRGRSKRGIRYLFDGEGNGEDLAPVLIRVMHTKIPLSRGRRIENHHAAGSSVYKLISDIVPVIEDFIAVRDVGRDDADPGIFSPTCGGMEDNADLFVWVKSCFA